MVYHRLGGRKDAIGGAMNHSLRAFLTWAGIAGGALTIAYYWSNSLKLTNDVHRVLEHWGMLLHNLWMFLGNIIAIEFNIKFAIALSLIFFYLIVSWTCAERSSLTKLSDNKNDDDYLTIIMLLTVTVFLASTIASLVFKYHTIFVVLDNIFVCLAFAYLVDGGMKEKIIGSIAYTVVYTVLDDYLKSTISPDGDFSAAVLAQLVSIFVIFIPLLFVPNKVLTRRISYMLFGAGIIVGISGAAKLSAGPSSETWRYFHPSSYFFGGTILWVLQGNSQRSLSVGRAVYRDHSDRSECDRAGGEFGLAHRAVERHGRDGNAGTGAAAEEGEGEETGGLTYVLWLKHG
jgi:hypothetical protein